MQIAEAHFRHTIRFMISEKKYISPGADFFITVVPSMHQKSQQNIQKNCISEFLIHSALKSPLCKLVVLIDMNMYILTKGWDFKTFFERKLCFGQLLLIY